LTNIDRAVKELVADHGYSESRLGGAKPVEHGSRAGALLGELHSGAWAGDCPGCHPL